MSLKKFLSHIWAGIKHIFEGLTPVLKKAIEVGVTITDSIKNFDLEHPGIADILTEIIPGHLDDDIKNKLREELPKIAIELRLIGATVNVTDTNEIMLAVVKVFKQLDGDYKSAFLHDLSILIAQVAADGKLDWADAVIVLQWYYEHQKAA